ncbi:MAG TPA: M23 family metallopeptidase [Natronosporangium sp.]|nr:M23 family metallopeptidase [Natronosporangium sp.]
MGRVLPRRPMVRRWRHAFLVALLVLGFVPGLPVATPPVVPSPAPLPVAVVSTGYQWPLSGPPVVTRRFDPPPQPWLPGHRGVDLAGEPGDLVRAAGPGVVFFAGQVAGVGVVSVNHPHGLRTTYQPVEPLVTAGERVWAGDPIGVLAPGHVGCPVAACLHWGLRRGDLYLDPLTLLGLGRVRLLPVHGELR